MNDLLPLVTTFAILTILIAINALYVAAEFSAVSVRRPRLAQMADGGNRLAGYMLGVVEDPHKLDTFVAPASLASPSPASSSTSTARRGCWPLYNKKQALM